MEYIFPLIIIFMALVFDFYNGMNDAANSIATVVSTRVLSPLQAVIWAASFNFLAAFIFGVHVANTIGKGIVETNIIDNFVIFSCVIGAIVTAGTATHLGMPISVSHSLIGGLAGAAIIKAGPSVLIASGLTKIVIFIFLAPIIGMVIAIIVSIITLWVVRGMRPRKVDNYFRKLQLVSAGIYSLSHGTNDAQKTMGIIALVLFTNGFLPEFGVPFWVVILSHSVIAAGTMIGGWKVIKTLGMNMTKLSPFGGFSAETSAGLTILVASEFGIPVSTTHTITGAIAGVGIIKGMSAIRWGVARNIIWAWILTIPTSAFFAILAYFASTYVYRLFVG